MVEGVEGAAFAQFAELVALAVTYRGRSDAGGKRFPYLHVNLDFLSTVPGPEASLRG